MKKIIALVIIAGGLSLTATAQTQRTDVTTQKGSRAGQKHHDKKMHDLEGLDLTQDQKTKLQAIKADGKAKVVALKAKNLSQDENKAQMKAIHMEQKKQMAAVLNADQKAIIKKKKQEAKTNGDGMKKGKYNNAMTPELKAKFKAIKEDTSLTPEQKKIEMQKLKEAYKSKKGLNA